MVKIRLEGLPDEVDEMIELLKSNYDVLAVSDEYKNSGNTQYVQVYIEMRLKNNNKRVETIKLKSQRQINEERKREREKRKAHLKAEIEKIRKEPNRHIRADEIYTVARCDKWYPGKNRMTEQEHLDVIDELKRKE
ncbi:DUF3970 family protein [Alkalihalobacterium elongatum]|uniref:DUF3970 family protein n=1 Tax=Alkalihalobacterium elongatum TaxID=2675466 RepID=UPI001C1F5A53|nr:DUF3970 family protein [Alkalihalobacterium elongatum]